MEGMTIPGGSSIPVLGVKGMLCLPSPAGQLMPRDEPSLCLGVRVPQLAPDELWPRHCNALLHLLN